MAAGLVARAYFTPTPRPETRLDIATPPTSDPFSFALSPDGRQVAFVALDQNALRVWIRRLDADQARALPGTDGASFPFWSPDGMSIGFFAGGKLKRMALDGTRPTVMADASSPRGGSWGSQGEILYVPAVGPIFRVAGRTALLQLLPLNPVIVTTGCRRARPSSDGRSRRSTPSRKEVLYANLIIN